MTRIAWLLGNWLSQLNFAFRHGWRNGQALRPDTMPNPIKPEYHDVTCPCRKCRSKIERMTL